MEHTTNPNKSFKGCRDPKTRMWTINLSQVVMHPQPYQDSHPNYEQHANNMYYFTLKRDIMRYLHQGAGSPVPCTWCAAIQKGNYATWPG